MHFSLFVQFSGFVRSKSGEQLVSMAVRVHPFPSRTRQLSSLAPTILGWKRPGKIGRRQHKKHQEREFLVFFLMSLSFHPRLLSFPAQESVSLAASLWLNRAIVTGRSNPWGRGCALRWRPGPPAEDIRGQSTSPQVYRIGIFAEAYGRAMDPPLRQNRTLIMKPARRNPLGRFAFIYGPTVHDFCSHGVLHFVRKIAKARVM